MYLQFNKQNNTYLDGQWDTFSFICCGNRKTLGSRGQPQPQHVVRHSCFERVQSLDSLLLAVVKLYKKTINIVDGNDRTMSNTCLVRKIIANLQA